MEVPLRKLVVRPGRLTRAPSSAAIHKAKTHLEKTIDDVTGAHIDPKLIQEARQEEMQGFREHKVYHHVAREVAVNDPEGKFIAITTSPLQHHHL